MDAFWKSLFSSLCSDVLFNLGPLVYGLHGCRPRCDELHLLAGVHISEGLRFPLPSSPVPKFYSTPPRSCSREHCLSSAGYERAKQEACDLFGFGGGALRLHLQAAQPREVLPCC